MQHGSAVHLCQVSANAQFAKTEKKAIEKVANKDYSLENAVTIGLAYGFGYDTKTTGHKGKDSARPNTVRHQGRHRPKGTAPGEPAEQAQASRNVLPGAGAAGDMPALQTTEEAVHGARQLPPS